MVEYWYQSFDPQKVEVFGEPGDGVGERSLAPSMNMGQYDVMEFTRDIPLGDERFAVRMGEVAAWFNQPGGGTQYQIIQIMENNQTRILSMLDALRAGIIR